MTKNKQTLIDDLLRENQNIKSDNNRLQHTVKEMCRNRKIDGLKSGIFQLLVAKRILQAVMLGCIIALATNAMWKQLQFVFGGLFVGAMLVSLSEDIRVKQRKIKEIE